MSTMKQKLFLTILVCALLLSATPALAKYTAKTHPYISEENLGFTLNGANLIITAKNSFSVVPTTLPLTPSNGRVSVGSYDNLGTITVTFPAGTKINNVACNDNSCEVKYRLLYRSRDGRVRLTPPGEMHPHNDFTVPNPYAEIKNSDLQSRPTTPPDEWSDVAPPVSFTITQQGDLTYCVSDVNLLQKEGSGIAYTITGTSKDAQGCTRMLLDDGSKAAFLLIMTKRGAYKNKYFLIESVTKNLVLS